MAKSNPLFPVGVFAKVNLRRYLRDPLALFFTVVFPLIFLFIFGGLFGGGGGASFRVALINQSDSQFAKTFVDQSKDIKFLKIDQDATTLDQAKEKMKRGELDAAIVLPAGFGDVSDKGYPAGQAEVDYTQNNQQAGQTLATILEGQFKEINRQFVQPADEPFKVVSVQTNDRALNSFDYTFAGLLGFSLIGLGIFGPVNVFPELKRAGVLRRISTTPIKVWQDFTSNVATQVVIGLAAVTIQFLVAIFVFHLNLVGNVFELILFIALSIIMLLGIGLAIGGWAKNARQAAPLTNLIVFPMMFLSGTFFPRFLMPEWLQNISAFFPLTPVIDGIRLIATEGKHLIDIAPQLGIIGLWMVVVYFVAFRVFRWD
jgi:ABC-2 type transport system permease protein